MKKKVKSDLKKSVKIFASVVWPRIRWSLGGGEYVSVERRDSPLCNLLDVAAGIDGFQVHDGQVYGISSRVQYGKSYDTFTIRSYRPGGVMTELNKRLRSIRSGSLYPYWTIQAYVDGDKLLSFCAARTTELYAVLGDKCVRTLTSPEGQRFLVVPWRIVPGAIIQDFSEND